MPLTRPEEGRLGPARGRGGPGRRESGPSEAPCRASGLPHPPRRAWGGAGGSGVGWRVAEGSRREGVEGYGFEEHSRPGVGGAGAGAGRGHLPGTRPELGCQGAPAAFSEGDARGWGSSPAGCGLAGGVSCRPRGSCWEEGSGQHPQPSARAGRHRGREEPGRGLALLAAAHGACFRDQIPASHLPPPSFLCPF